MRLPPGGGSAIGGGGACVCEIRNGVASSSSFLPRSPSVTLRAPPPSQREARIPQPLGNRRCIFVAQQRREQAPALRQRGIGTAYFYTFPSKTHLYDWYSLQNGGVSSRGGAVLKKILALAREFCYNISNYTVKEYCSLWKIQYKPCNARWARGAEWSFSPLRSFWYLQAL